MYASTALVVIATALPALAFEKISIPSNIKANTDFEVQITNDLGNGSNSVDAAYSNFNVYLATAPPSSSGLMPTCLLSKGNKIDTTSVKVNIPADLFPSDATFAITTLELKQGKDKYSGSSGYKYSGQFSLEGATGSWGKAEKGGLSFIDGDTAPCSSYACARKCDDQYFDDLKKNQQSQDKDVYKSLYKLAYECITKCPGASMRKPDSIGSSTTTTSASGTVTATSSNASGTSSQTDSASSDASDSSTRSGFVTSTSSITPTNSGTSGASGSASATQGSVSSSVIPSGASHIAGTGLFAVLTVIFAASQLA
ncbi:unnamed protein product [Clonostachys byssicola]|uniref:Uncharacterized protein n=1 Tax=Clonostachys byssicola TaxID=160290 RepID=A0A9N9UKS1_9HYPO|nr:unnamed protein product [Clonostachys byssicola]